MWLNEWRLHRAEKALAKLRRQREMLDHDDHEYGGLMIEQTEQERRAEQRVESLKRKRSTDLNGVEQ